MSRIEKDMENENKAGLYRVLVFIIGLIGVCVTFFGIYRLLIVIMINRIYGWENNLFLATVGIFATVIAIGILIIFGSVKLSHRLLPSEEDIERFNTKQQIKEIKKQAAIEANNIKVEEYQAKQRELRAIKAKERATKYQERQNKNKEAAYKRKLKRFDSFQKGLTNFKPYEYDSELRIYQLTATPWRLYIEMVLGLVLIAGSFLWGLNHVTSPSFNSNSYLWILYIVVVFWAGMFLWIKGKGYLNDLAVSCIVTQGHDIYLLNLKRLRIQEAAIFDEDNILAYSKIGVVINNLAMINARLKYKETVVELFKSEEFPDLVRRMLEEDEFNRLFEINNLNTLTRYAKSYRRYFYKIYLKSVVEKS